MYRLFIILGCFFLFPLHAIEELPAEAPFMPEVHLSNKAIHKIKKAQKNSSRKAHTQIEAKNQASAPEADYSPSLTESLNNSNTQKNHIKRQLSANKPQKNLEEPSSSAEVANFGNVSVSISERKKEEKLIEADQNK